MACVQVAPLPSWTVGKMLLNRWALFFLSAEKVGRKQRRLPRNELIL